jgi:hypothetical protein
MKYLILIVPSLILQIGCTAAPVTKDAVNDAHPEWSNRDCDRIAKLETWSGMTVDQYECVLGRGMDKMGWQPGIVGWFAMGCYNHRHIGPDSVLKFDDGSEVRNYTVMKYSNSNGRAGSSARFVNGRYEGVMAYNRRSR